MLEITDCSMCQVALKYSSYAKLTSMLILKDKLSMEVNSIAYSVSLSSLTCFL